MIDEKNKKTAVALEYNDSLDAPKILATGKGHLADKIVEKAKEAGVPLYKDAKLANTLSKLDIGDSIPKELYKVVAEILVFVDRAETKKGKKLGR
ncbi:MAG: EscU/YscU/HrcU family type III secretion system export apparatus switch protein [Lachnospiraceae bacterium]|nr:EscU/YscU/HrcU family type III secretion system export apparatus switch protein [Lachnospiraceae bacterium]